MLTKIDTDSDADTQIFVVATLDFFNNIISLVRKVSVH
jgi:hypothetical protein